ncbi:uncharacterized protein LOC116149992 [Camelus dromedarius]|uniref:uncharacterized protein LOC116149992 n=1 Tax=Camelus dromedarius TaxID=9838 RepID=UPI00311A616E
MGASPNSCLCWGPMRLEQYDCSSGLLPSFLLMGVTIWHSGGHGFKSGSAGPPASSVVASTRVRGGGGHQGCGLVPWSMLGSAVSRFLPQPHSQPPVLETESAQQEQGYLQLSTGLLGGAFRKSGLFEDCALAFHRKATFPPERHVLGHPVTLRSHHPRGFSPRTCPENSQHFSLEELLPGPKRQFRGQKSRASSCVLTDSEGMLTSPLATGRCAAMGCSTLYSRDTNVHLQDLRTAPPGVVLPPWLGTRCAQRADCAWGGVGGILGSVLWTLQECDGLKTAPLLPPPGRPEPPQPGPAPWVARGFVGTHAVSVCLCGQDKVADLELRWQTYFLTELEAASPRSRLDRVGSASGESLFLASSRCRLLRQPFLRAQAGGERSLSSSSYKAADPID